MDGKRNWTFQDFHAKLDQLDARIRDKALDLADELMRSGKYSEKDALEEAIVRAEEWFYDMEG